MMESHLRLADVVKDRELRADVISGVELPQGPFVAAISRQLDAACEVTTGGVARLVGRGDVRSTDDEQDGEADLPAQHRVIIDNIR